MQQKVAILIKWESADFPVKHLKKNYFSEISLN